MNKFSDEQFIVNDIGNFVFGIAGAAVYGSCKRRKQKFVMSFTIVQLTEQVQLELVTLRNGEKMSEISEKIRKNFGSTDTRRDAGLKTPETVVRFDDIVYGTDPIWQSLDVYRPVNAGDGNLPVIVSVHGGGWVYGDKNRYQYYCMSLAERGFAVVNFSYRLAPEHKFPVPLEDTCMVFSWVQAQIIFLSAITPQGLRAPIKS